MVRMRRLRVNEAVRSLVRENTLDINDLVYPVFVIEGENIKNPVESMPGIYQWSIDRFDQELSRILEAGIRAILIFGIPEHKDEKGSEAYNDQGITQRAIRHIKEKAPELLVIADVCLCEYTSHGHCGLVRGTEILNDETLVLLGKMSVSLVESGADVIAPSDMMDGRVEYIRKVLDENGFYNTMIMAYSAKFASGYYSPFRDAAHSAPSFGDRRTYQMDPANGREAVRECENDIDEGADIIMVKPALAYLDVVKEVCQHTGCPVAVYNVSGEYSMVKAAAKNGWIDEKRIVMENLIAMKRAGARIIITYHALDVAAWLKEEGHE
ncbi:MAG: porphobilinogen synthase [Lachnospiraceae bacterium]|nr:porphobilinogen synthase [Lachnospiraceae bacterium]